MSAGGVLVALRLAGARILNRAMEDADASKDRLGEEDVRASVSAWIDGLRDGDDGSAEELWRRYFEALARVAERRLPGTIRGAYDGEDVALSAFHSMCTGVREGRFPELNSREDLWSLLIVIAARKSGKRHRAETTLKRGDGRRVDAASLGPQLAPEPTPEFAALVAEETEHLLALLPDDAMRRIAQFKLDGRTNEDIAAELGCAVRTVERRLGLIRRTWRERGVA